MSDLERSGSKKRRSTLRCSFVASRKEEILKLQLYDRSEQERMLLEAYHKSIEKVQIVIIAGAAGTGKTSLANTLIPIVEADGGLFFKAKFDQNKHVTANSPLFRAFKSFAKRVIARGPEEVERVKAAIEEELGSELEILLNVLPELTEILNPKKWLEMSATSTYDSSSESSSNGFGVDSSESQLQVVSVFRRFLRSICNPGRRIVAMYDDLQYADAVTLTLLGTRPEVSTDGSGFMLLGTCRGNEVAMDGELATSLREIEARGVKITDIAVDNLRFEALVEMLAQGLNLSVDESMPLAEVVYSKTKGNPFFSVQYLFDLEETGALYKDGEKWGWNEEKLLVAFEENGSEDPTIQLIAQRMKELSPHVVECLQVAACFGGDFTEELITHACTLTCDQVSSGINVAIDKGVIIFEDENGTGHFVHDKFQESAYSLIPENHRPSFHLSIGRSLRKQLPSQEIRKHFSTILNQMKYGIHLMDDVAEQEEMAQMCLRAARKAKKSSCFSAGSDYAEIGLRCLGHNHWEDQYTLSLELYNAAIELAYCSGKHKRVAELVRSVLGNAKNSEDKLHAHLNKINSLAAQRQTHVAIAYCIEVLRRMGQPFPRQAKSLSILRGYMKTKRTLSQLSDDDILGLPPMKDQKVANTMTFIHVLFPLVQQADHDYSALIAFRLVHLTLKHGLGSISSAAFGFYGAILSRGNRIDEGYRYVKLSFRILDRFPSDVWMARCLLSSSGTVLSIRQPLRELLQPLMKGHRLGLKCGDLETGFICALFQCILRIISGDPLLKVGSRLLHLIDLCINYNQLIAGSMAKGVYIFCCRLAGIDPLPVNGMPDEEEMIQEAKENNRKILLTSVLHFRYINHFVHNNYAQAELVDAERKRILVGSFNAIPLLDSVHTFHQGMVAASYARKSRRRLAVACARLKDMQAAVIHCPTNYMHKAHILEAEILSARERFDEAMCKYEESISYAKKAGYVNEEALAYEKAGKMLLDYGKKAKAMEYFKDAREMYARWNASQKVSEMNEMIESLSW